MVLYNQHFFAMIGVGVSLLTLSTFGASSVGYSRCVAPENVNITSPNCTQIENVNQPPSGGLYSGWGPAGAFLTILGVVGLPSFVVFAAYNYFYYGRRNREQPTQQSNTVLENTDDKPGSTMDISTERLKIDIVANYTTTVYTNMLVLCFTVLLTAFAAFFAPFVAKQITLIEFLVPFLATEIMVVWVIIRQFEKFNRRTKYLDTLIGKIESTPPVALGTLESILDKVRKQ